MKQEYNLSKMKKRTNPFAKQLKKQKTEEEIVWSNLSIASAMRGMETEDPYKQNDLKSLFKEAPFGPISL